VLLQDMRKGGQGVVVVVYGKTRKGAQRGVLALARRFARCVSFTERCETYVRQISAAVAVGQISAAVAGVLARVLVFFPGWSKTWTLCHRRCRW